MAAPTPSTQDAIYQDTNTGILYFWNHNTLTWT